MVDAASISAITVPIFSIVAVPKADRVSPILKQPHAKLAGIDPYNDGLLLWYDTIVARGYLLGYVNADHLAIAVPISQQVPSFSFLFKDDVPRAAIARAAMKWSLKHWKASLRFENLQLSEPISGFASF